MGVRKGGRQELGHGGVRFFLEQGQCSRPGPQIGPQMHLSCITRFCYKNRVMIGSELEKMVMSFAKEIYKSAHAYFPNSTLLMVHEVSHMRVP